MCFVQAGVRTFSCAGRVAVRRKEGNDLLGRGVAEHQVLLQLAQ